MEHLMGKPTKNEIKLALKSAEVLKATTDRKGETVKVKIDQKYVMLPKKALKALNIIMKNIAEGKGVYVYSSDSELTTQEAADILNVSRPHLVKLLEEGVIPHKKVGTHRRILIDDVHKYENQLRELREQNLNFLAEQAQELGLGY
jgi:excisionase family DNA binding protein